MMRTCVLFALLLVGGCGGAPSATNTQPAVTPAAGSAAPQQAVARAEDTTAPLGEFQPLTRADADLYLKVMRTAAERLKNLPAADRQALKIFRAMTAGSAQAPSMDQMAAMQRAGELVALDGVVAREMGVGRRYESIKGRVPHYGMPAMSGEGDDPVTPEERARVKERIRRFNERRTLDEGVLAPFKDEIQALQKEVDLITHPESIPK